MQKILTEWRKYLKEVVSGEAIKEIVEASLAKTNFTSKIIDAFKIAGISAPVAIEFSTAVKSAMIYYMPKYVDKGEELFLRTFVESWVANFLVRFGQLEPTVAMAIVGRIASAATPLAALIALKDVYDISVAWKNYIETAGKTKNVRKFGDLRAIEDAIKAGSYDKPETSIQNMQLMNKLNAVLKINPSALEFFPTVVQQLKPEYQEYIKKTAEKYKRLAKG